MTAAELATCRVIVDPVSPAQVGDTSWRARCFMNEDLVCPSIDSSACGYSSMAWSYIILLLRGSLLVPVVCWRPAVTLAMEVPRVGSAS
jgi:hypothetical protein